MPEDCTRGVYRPSIHPVNRCLSWRFTRRTGVGPTVGAVTDEDLVVDFLNTVDHESGTDVTADPEAWGRWLAERELADSTAGARAVRTALRAAAGPVRPARRT